MVRPVLEDASSLVLMRSRYLMFSEGVDAFKLIKIR